MRKGVIARKTRREYDRLGETQRKRGRREE